MEGDVPEPLRSRLQTYFHVEDPEGVDALREIVASESPPLWVKPFREQLTDAITHRSITPEMFETLTGDDRESRDEVVQQLRELWLATFDSTPPE